jgi:hypothetical protein
MHFPYSLVLHIGQERLRAMTPLPLITLKLDIYKGVLCDEVEGLRVAHNCPYRVRLGMGMYHIC